MSFKITLKTHMLCLVISFAISIVMYKAINLVLYNFITSVPLFFSGRYFIFKFYLSLIVIVILISVIHEFLHGITYKIFGGRVNYGFKWGICAYTREISGKPIKRTYFLLVLLFPLVLISVFSLLAGGWIGEMAYILNLLGSSGDLIMAFTLCKYNPGSKIIDRDYGFDVV